MERAGLLARFVTGVSRFAPHGALPEVGDRLVRADLLQNAYLASLRLRAPVSISSELAHLSKVWIDHVCKAHLRHCDTFLFYNGCGLASARECQHRGITSIVETVNSHVIVQQELLREEHRAAGLRWRPFHKRETARRVKEYQVADYILTPSEFVKQSFLAQGHAPERILKVPYRVRRIPGTEVNDYLNTEGVDDVFRILYVGTLSLRKGLRYLVEAFRKFQHPHKELWLVGPSAPPTGLDGQRIPDGVKFIGTLKGKELLSAYRKATVFCLPTIEDGFGLVMAEALANGIPVISTVNSGAADLYSHGKEGYILPIRDANAIHDALNQLAEEQGLRERFSRNARSRAEEMFAQSASEVISPLASAIRAVSAKN